MSKNLSERHPREANNPVHPILEELHKLRRARGIAQKDVAEYLGVSRTAVWQWETGVHIPAFPYVAAYAQAVGARLAIVTDNEE